MSSEGPTYEELRAAYLARVLKVDYGRVLSAVRTWNRIKTPAEKIRRAQGRAAENLHNV